MEYYTLEKNFNAGELYKEFLIMAIIILMNPFIGMVVAIVQLIKSSDNWEENSFHVLTFLISTAIWISLVNITKEIESDQINYSKLFLKVPIQGLKQTMLRSWDGSGKEPVYSFITWAMYYICGGSLRMFYFIISMMIYMLHFIAGYKLFRKMNTPKWTLISFVIVLTFFTQFFSISLHLIRQVLATSVALYAIVYHATTGKNNWILLFAAPLIHSSAFFLVGLSVIPWFYSWMNLKKIIIIISCLCIIVIFSSILGASVGNAIDVDAIRYAADRFGKNNAADKGFISLGIMIIVFVPLTICSLLSIWRYKKELVFDCENKEEWDSSVHYRYILPIAFIALIEVFFVFSFSRSPLLQSRFFFFSYSLFPLLLPLMFQPFSFSKLYQIAISMLFIARFFMIHNQSDFTYASVLNLLFQPATYYFTGNFSPYYLN